MQIVLFLNSAKINLDCIHCSTPLLYHCKGRIAVLVDTFFEDSNWQYLLFSGILDSYFISDRDFLGLDPNLTRIVGMSFSSYAEEIL